MEILLQVIFLVIGFVFLIKGADIFVDGSSSVAKKLKVPSVIIGLTIVAMGTSLPEMAVSISASVKNENAMALSNVIGSNMFNLLVVLGVCAILGGAVKVEKSIIKKEFPFSIIIVVIMLLFSVSISAVGGEIGITGIFNSENANTVIGEVGKLEGVIMLLLFVLYIAGSIRSAIHNRIEENERPDDMSTVKSVAFIIVGIVLIAVGGDVVVDSASEIALAFGMSQTLVGLTIVALGTSLPELVTSIVAAKKGETDLAVGNVVGSNVFNVLFVLGMAAAISPVTVIAESIADTIVLISVSIMTYAFCIRKHKITRAEGAVMVFVYAVYLVYIIWR